MTKRKVIQVKIPIELDAFVINFNKKILDEYKNVREPTKIEYYHRFTDALLKNELIKTDKINKQLFKKRRMF
jgi:hypothetical protein